MLNFAPSIWQTPNFNVITVGAVDNEGLILQSSQYQPSVINPLSGVDVWAPAKDIVTAYANNDYVLTTGSSAGKLIIASHRKREI